jgi:lysophospholipase L1-like esterase
LHKETLFFVDEGGTDPSAALLFQPARVVALTSATEDTTFEPGLDYIVDIEAGRVACPRGSRIPVTRRSELVALANGPDDAFHLRQVAVTYEPQSDLWSDYGPQLVEDPPPRTLGRLQRGEPLVVCLAGDSISAGYNASGFTGVAPHQPAYGSLVASALEREYGSPIAFHNFAVAGWTADNAVHDIDRLVAPNPDLVIVAFGMNDAGYAEAEHYAANIESIRSSVRQAVPKAEFVLVAPMLPNPEWDYPVLSRFPAYRDALARLSGSGTTLADLTTVWTRILRRKGWFDLAGNGFNHPNDFGHRLYARFILAALGASRV